MLNIEIQDDMKCDKGWGDSGECCCNCKYQKKLMCHPMNGNTKLMGIVEDKVKFGKGSINEQLGWVCTMIFEDGSNDGKYIFYDFEHGMCEMHTLKKIN